MYSAAIEARTIGASAHEPALDLNTDRSRDRNLFFGIPAIKRYPFGGSAIVIWDSGPGRVQPPPLANLAAGRQPDDQPGSARGRAQHRGRARAEVGLPGAQRQGRRRLRRQALPHRRVHALTASAAALAAAAVCLFAAPGARAVTYGISDAQGLFASCPANDDPCSSPGGVSGFWSSAAFKALTTTAARPVTGIRLSVKYNAVSTWDGGSGCTLSNPFLHAYVDQGGRTHPMPAVLARPRVRAARGAGRRPDADGGDRRLRRRRLGQAVQRQRRAREIRASPTRPRPRGGGTTTAGSRGSSTGSPRTCPLRSGRTNGRPGTSQTAVART